MNMNMTGTTATLNAERNINRGPSDLADKSRDYDRALRASQMMRSRFQQPGSASMMYQSGMGGGMSMAQTAMLGESAETTLPSPVKVTTPSAVPILDLGGDGGVVSELGESYVDGVARRTKPYGVSQSQQEEEEELEDGGVLGLLAQIYGRTAKSHRPGI